MSPTRIDWTQVDEAKRAAPLAEAARAFNEPPPPAEPASPRTVEVSTSRWAACPLKSHLDAHYQRVTVPFDERCPATLPCLVLRERLAVGRALTADDSVPEDWTPGDVARHNREVARREPEATAVPVPVVGFDSPCARCSRGGTVALVDQPEEPRRAGIRTSGSGNVAALVHGPALAAGARVRVKPTARAAVRGQVGTVDRDQGNGYVFLRVASQRVSVSRRSLEVV